MGCYSYIYDGPLAYLILAFGLLIVHVYMMALGLLIIQVAFLLTWYHELRIFFPRSSGCATHPLPDRFLDVSTASSPTGTTSALRSLHRPACRPLGLLRGIASACCRQWPTRLFLRAQLLRLLLDDWRISRSLSPVCAAALCSLAPGLSGRLRALASSRSKGQCCSLPPPSGIDPSLPGFHQSLLPEIVPLPTAAVRGHPVLER